MDKVLSMIGMSARAGKVLSGEFSVEKAVKTFKAYLVIVAGDASDNTKKKFRNMCEFYEVPLIEYSNKDELGGAIGRELRSSVAITDEGLANAVVKKWQVVTNLMKEE